MGNLRVTEEKENRKNTLKGTDNEQNVKEGRIKMEHS